MCGIFGIISSKESDYSEKFYSKSLKQLAYLSESRGKDSSGLCAYNQIENSIDLVKGPIAIKKLFNSLESKKLIRQAFRNKEHYKYAFGHSRLVTNGSQLDNANNQPVVKNGIISVHNGIIANDVELWEEYPDFIKKNEIDTEILLDLIDCSFKKNESIEKSVSNTIKQVDGTVTAAFGFNNLDSLILATNNGSLYIIHNNKDILFFSSEEYIMKSFEKKVNLEVIGKYSIKQIRSNNGININLNNFNINKFSFDDKEFDTQNNKKDKIKINLKNIKSKDNQLSAVVDLNKIHLHDNYISENKLLEFPINKIHDLKRCSRCILPQTFPYIKFDVNGVCNYCHNYKSKIKHNTIKDLEKILYPYRKANNQPEILVPLSGGRDSCYTLHYLVKELKMKVITYTYDWGMVTDLARRNCARICGKLGVENIIVAADINIKRRNIRKNVSAWLKKPELGMIPLFMAGDKYFFYYANQILVQNELKLSIWGSNPLENTDFKSGFTGVRPAFNKDRIDDLRINQKLVLIKYFLSNFMYNPAYLNSSLYDTIGAFFSRYLISRKGYLQIFDYIDWDENKVNNLILDKYNWEKSIDANSTWRIGDGTAAFYNYIYFTSCGFSEFDTFRSNQIREGQIDRESALRMIEKDNLPRYQTIKWYLEIIGLNFTDVINRINSIPRKY